MSAISPSHSPTQRPQKTPIQGWGRQTRKRAKPYFVTTCSRVHMPGTIACLRGSQDLLSHQAEGFSQDLPRTSSHWAFLWLIEDSCVPESWALVVRWLMWEDTESPWNQRPCGTMSPCFFRLFVLFFCSSGDCAPSHPHAGQVSTTELHPPPFLNFYI